VHALDDPRRLHTAFSLESVIDELVFVVGPALATVLATNVIAPGGIIVAVAAGVTGGLIFLSLRGTEPPPRRSDGTDAGARSRADAPSGNVSFPRPAIAYPGMPVIALVFVAMGTFFGSNDVSAVAFAEEHGSQTAAGLLLAIIAFGSLVAGLGYGAVHWRSRLSVRFAIGCVAIAIGVSWYNTAHSITSLAVVMFFAGFSVSPTVITGNAIVQALIPPHRLTEGLAWVGTSIGAGFALGSWLAGARIDAVGASGGFWVATISGWVCALLALAVLPSLRNKERVER
jgi:predicted MFS family arabinose efflux permease